MIRSYKLYKVLYTKLVILVLFSALSVFGTTITVSNTNDSGAGSLRDAIAGAASGDIILFNVNGTITLTSGEIEISKNLTITGPGAESLAISGNKVSRVFSITGGYTVVISGLFIENGDDLLGGGIFN
ncbi:MAG: hypothetical protein HY647_02890, partial [Acidobacteria bacterium]|nr:hypothetical protein [Acidobacteriota bacterium]